MLPMRIKIQLFTLLFCLLLLSGCRGFTPPPSVPVEIGAAQPAESHTSPRGTTATYPTTDIPAPAAGDVILRDNPVKDATVSVEPSSDLWQRIRDGFQFSHQDLADSTLSQLNWFTRNPDYVYRVSERAAPYLHYIVEQIEARNMPLEIALLPIVESGFQPFAYSPSAASGLWQFIPSSGKYYGLPQNEWYDGRRDVIAATDAALTYLQKLNLQFEGDWLRTLAAYNAGEGTVGRAVRKNQRAGKPTDFWSLDLPRETRAYVPKLLAISHLVFQPENYGIALHPIANQAYFDVTDAGSQIDLALAAQFANISLGDLYQLNSGYNRWSTPPTGPHTLLLPLENSSQLQQQLSLNPERLHWKHHTIQQGDTLSHIAEQQHTSTYLLKQHNDIVRNRLIVGNSLRFPAPSAPDALYKTNADHQLAANRNIQMAAKKITHTVRKGDSWWALSRRYGVDMHKLAQWNKATPSRTLRPGQKLVILQGGKANTTRIAAKQVQHKVKSGDSLWGIAHRYQVAITDIKRWNKLGQSLIKPGQKLLIHLPK